MNKRIWAALLVLFVLEGFGVILPKEIPGPGVDVVHVGAHQL
ncbi:hypothetical protein [Alicyclobacillus tolerans]|uniref:Uncharacterized protein n=1 Tax=Alicyclobacillus tolerans TaxID=90970 RepID=A0ABT9LWI5_9BACL|nr:hypothetical protein [Alicyclobacillus tengchongensis]MDP9728541.1 hypothetical protein [Alicyclobacillus tengchongensis]